MTEIDRLAREILALNRALARELCEDDEFGAEYTYVNALKTELKQTRETLRATTHQARVLLSRLSVDALKAFDHYLLEKEQKEAPEWH